MLQLGFEPMLPLFKRAKMVHALDRAAAVIGVSQPHLLGTYVAATEYRAA
jgi:hypothetical protein